MKHAIHGSTLPTPLASSLFPEQAGTDPAVVYVVDDNEAVRDSLAMLLETAGFAVACFDSAETFLQAFAGFAPCQAGCLILDVKLRDMDGPKLHAELNRRGCTLSVIYLTAYGTIPMTVQAMRAGAVDFLTKPVNPHDFLEKIAKVLRAQLSTEHQRKSTHQTELPATLENGQCETLTPREREVLDMVMAGHANKIIAKNLGISYRTVELHRSHILQKTGKNNMIELVHCLVNGAPSPQNGGAQAFVSTAV